MKKKIALILTAIMMTGMLSACTENKNAQYLSEVKAAKYVTLGEYKGIEVPVTSTTVTDTDVDSYLDSMVSSATTTNEITDRAAALGDVANIDFVGKIDGVAFDGGSAEGQELELGSGSFIDGFEDGVVGMEIGETKDITVTFPDTYTSEDLQGKEAVFTVTLNSIGEKIPAELNDEYAVSLQLEGVSDVDGLREYVMNYLTEQANSQYDSAKEQAVLSAVEANATFKDLPEKMVTRFNDTLSTNLSSYASAYGIDLATYLSYYTGTEVTDADAEILTQANNSARSYMLMQAIADKEDLNVTDEELNTQLEAQATSAGYETVDEYKENIDLEAFKEYLMTDKVLTFLVENAVITDTAATDTTEQAADTAEETAE